MKHWLGPALAAPAKTSPAACFPAAPFAMVVLLSVQAGSDPFAPLSLTPSWEQFNAIFSDAYHLTIIAQTSLLALGVCLATTLLGYPLALW